MGFWSNLFGKNTESRNLGPYNEDYRNNSFNSLFAADTVNKIAVTERTALQLSTVYACVKIIAESQASVPKNIFKAKPNGDSMIAAKSYAQKVLKRPNEFMTAYNWDMAMTYALCLRGNAFSYIERDGNGRPLNLWPLHPDRIGYEVKDRKVYYIVDGKERVESKDMLHFRGLTKDGVWGLNPIQLQAQQLSVGLSVQASQKDTYEKGGNLDGILVFPNRLDKDTRDKTVEGWQNKTGGIGGNRTAILDNGATYQTIGVSTADKQFLESKQVSGEEVARMFNVPLHLLQFPNNQSYASVEQLEIGFVNHCLLPISKMKEEEIEFKLLMPYEDNHYCKYNLNGLMRGDFAGRMEGYRTLHSMGLPLNRILKLEDMDSVEGGDISLSPLNMIGTDRLNEYHFSTNKTQPSQSTGQGGADNKKRGLTFDEVING